MPLQAYPEHIIYTINAAEAAAYYAIIDLTLLISAKTPQILKKISVRGQSSIATGEVARCFHYRYSITHQGIFNIVEDDIQLSISACCWNGDQPIPVASKVQVQVWGLMETGDRIFIEALFYG